MPISDKTRKVLWGRSGNRCAICKHELIVDATVEDSESVVGEECHIVSSKVHGLRHDPSYPKDNFDLYENLILLCRIHHKMIDDQSETYSTDILRQMKSNHEVLVTQKLSDKPPKPRPLKFRRVKQNIPELLSRLTTGKQVLDLVTGIFALSMDNDELQSESEVAVVGDFLQTVRDWGDIGNDLEPADRLNTAFNLTQSLQELETAGFYVFGAREVQFMEGGNQTEPSNWPVSIIKVLRKDNKEIIYVEAAKLFARQDELDRIEIEGKFGQAKWRFGLNLVMTKLAETSE